MCLGLLPPERPLCRASSVFAFIHLLDTLCDSSRGVSDVCCV